MHAETPKVFNHQPSDLPIKSLTRKPLHHHTSCFGFPLTRINLSPITVAVSYKDTYLPAKMGDVVPSIIFLKRKHIVQHKKIQY